MVITYTRKLHCSVMLSLCQSVTCVCLSPIVEIATLTREDGKTKIKVLKQKEVEQLIKRHEAEEAKAEKDKKDKEQKEKDKWAQKYIIPSCHPILYYFVFYIKSFEKKNMLLLWFYELIMRWLIHYSCFYDIVSRYRTIIYLHVVTVITTRWRHHLEYTIRAECLAKCTI